MEEIFLKEESYEIVGICMEVFNELGSGFKEVVYKDALAYELNNRKIPFKREKCFPVHYKDVYLRSFYVDFLVYDQIILEIKAADRIHTDVFQQIKNYLKASGLKVGIIFNFGETSLKFKRVVL